MSFTIVRATRYYPEAKGLVIEADGSMPCGLVSTLLPGDFTLGDWHTPIPAFRNVASALKAAKACGLNSVSINLDLE